MKYCFDTCAFIEGWHTHYRQKTFPSMWEKLAQLIPSGDVVSPYEVYEELKDRSRPQKDEDIDIIEWINPYKDDIFHRATEATTAKLPTVLAYWKHIPLRGEKDYADPYVIAFALANNCIVITYEKHRIITSDKKLRIPTICSKVGVKCINLPEFLYLMPWSF